MPLISLLAAVALGGAGAMVCDVRSYGAKGDNTTLDTAAIQSAIDTCARESPQGSTVLVSPGAYRIGPINLRSNMQLRLEAGAGLYGSPNAEDWSQSVQYFGGHKQVWYDSLVRGYGLQNVSIIGANGGETFPGKASIIDGVGWKWWCRAKVNGSGIPLRMPVWCKEFNPTNQSLTGAGRPRLVNIFNSTGVLLAGFTAQNSPQWTVHLQYSTDIVATNLTILSPRMVGNTDGFDPESCDRVLLTDSWIDVGDDGVSIKSYNVSQADAATLQMLQGRTLKPSPDDTVMVPCTNTITRRVNILSRNWCIGSGTFGGIYNVLFEDSQIGEPDKVSVPWAIKFKSHEYYPGDIVNVTIRRINIGPVGPTPWMYPDKTAAAFHLGLTYGGKPPRSRSGAPHVRNLTIQDVYIANTDQPGGINGLPEACFEDVMIRNVTFANIRAPNPQWNCDYMKRGTFNAEDNDPPIKCNNYCDDH